MAHLFFVGTASGKTSGTRFHSSIFISTLNYSLLIDAGDGISKALLLHSLDFNSIDGILITHLHPDHYTGLASLIVQMKMYGRKKNLNIYIIAGLEKPVKDFITNSYLYPERLGFKIKYHSFNDNVVFQVSDEIDFLPRENSHLASVSESKKNSSQCFSCYSFLLSVENKKIHYTSDVGSEKDLSLFDDYKSEYLISEITHVQPEDIINKISKDDFKSKIIFTHYSDEDISAAEKFIKNLDKNLKSRVVLASDGLEITL